MFVKDAYQPEPVAEFEAKRGHHGTGLSQN
jgi:hypothetical protein